MIFAISLVLTIILHSITFFVWLGITATIISLTYILYPAFLSKLSPSKKTLAVVCILLCIIVLSLCSSPDKCKTCGGRKEVSCSICGGSKEVSCSTCGGNGKCSRCNGSGKVPGFLWGTNRCPRCNGYASCSTCGGQGKNECLTCNGKGKVECPTCNGKGK